MFNKNLKKEDASSPKNDKKSKINSFLSIFRSSQKHLTPKVTNNNNLNLNIVPLKINENIKVPNTEKNLTISNTNLNNQNNYEIIESKIPFNKKDITDNFVFGIIICGLDEKNLQYVDESSLFQASCGHEECSILSSLKPSILKYYLNENNKDNCEINNTVSDLCFPLGIKLCYKCKKINNKFENIPLSSLYFMNIINNQFGDKFYIITLYYFRIIQKKNFEKIFSIDPINEYMKHNNEINQNLSNSAITKNFNSLNEIILYDHICIPESVSLISKYPYFSQMNECLKNIISIPKEKTNLIIQTIINEILVPPSNSLLEFFLPHSSKPLKLISPFNENNELLSDLNLSIIFKYFKLEKIVEIFKIILLEQKILFISNNLNLLSEISFIFISLIYPLKWVGTYIPILSIKTIGFLQSPVPFIMGMDNSLLNFSIEKGIYSFDNKEISLIYIEENKGKNKTKIKSNIDMPSRINNFLIDELKSVQKIIKNGSLNNNLINEKIQLIFLKVMIIFIGEYKKYVYYSENDDKPIFDKEGLISNFKIENKESRTSIIINEIISTQNFMQFLINQKKNYFLKEGFNKEIEIYQIDVVSVIQKNLSKNTSLNKVLSKKSLSKAKEKKEDNNRRLSLQKENINNSNENNHNTSFLSNNASRDSFNFVSNQRDAISLLSGINPFNKYNHSNQLIKKISKQYLLYPYFFPNNLLVSNLEKKHIEDYITNNLSKKKTNDISLNEDHCYIIPFENKKMNFSDNLKSKKKYVIPSNDDFNLNNEENEIKENEVDIEKDEKKILLNLFKNIFIKKVEEIEDFSEIIKKYFLKEKIKKYFLNFLLFKIKLHPENLNKLIGESEFKFLFKIIKNIFQFPSSSKDYFIDKGYTIVSFLYYKFILLNRKERKEYFIYEEIIKQGIYCPSWRKRDFWEFFIDDELTKKKEFEYLFCLKKIHSIMNKINLTYYFQKEILLSDFIMNMVGEDIYNKFDSYFNGGEQKENTGFFI